MYAGEAYIFSEVPRSDGTLRASGSERESLTSRIFGQILVKILVSQMELHIGSRPPGGDLDPLWSDLGRFCDSNITSSLKKVMHIVGVSVLVYLNMFKSIEQPGSTLRASGSERESLTW